VALPIGAGAAALVLARRLGLVEPLVLLASVGAMDVGAWVIGSAGARWEARAGGVAALVPVTVASAVVLVPKFPAEAPFVLAAVVALLAPLGVRLARYLTGGDATPHPALDRVDSLVLAGPAWVLAATALLRV
jgi:hypothetical protein